MDAAPCSKGREPVDDKVVGQNSGADDADPASAAETPAQRAIAEAEARRQEAAGDRTPPETGGRDGPDPVRYGDWEVRGLASDF